MRRVVYLIVTLVLLGTAEAQATPARAGERGKDSLHMMLATNVRTVIGAPVPVLLRGDTIMVVRASLPGSDTRMRAAAISARLEAFAADVTVPVSALQATELDGNVEIAAGDRFLFMVAEHDAVLSGTTRAAFAADALARLRTSVTRYREEFSTREIILGIVYSLIATVVFLLLLRLIALLFRSAARRVGAGAKVLTGKQTILRQDRIERSLLGLLRLLRFAFLLLLLYVWAQFVLSTLPWTRPLAGDILRVVLHPLRTLWISFVRELPDIAFLVVLVLITRYTLRFIRYLFGEVESGATHIPGFYQDWARPTYRIVRILVLAFALVVAFPYIPGSSSEAFKGVSIFLGVLFSLGSSSAVSNAVAGVILTYMRAFTTGDIVAIGETTGRVVAGNLLVTRVRTFKNEDVTIPNSTILTAQVMNYSTQARERKLILHTEVTIGYDAPWRQVHEMMRRAAASTEGVLAEPAPFVLQSSLDDFYVRYQLNAFTDRPEELPRLYSDLHKHIQDQFNTYGVQIMSPNYLHDRDVPTIVPPDRWHMAPARPQGTAGADD